MVVIYTGTPGSGKSYHATERMDTALRRGINVIANYPIKLGYKHKGKFVYLKNMDFSVDFFVEFARENHLEKKEGQTCVFIDEAHIIFNRRGYDVKERLKWCEFLACSRHYGYDFFLITQRDRAIDQQILGLVEFEFRHRKLSGMGWRGWLLIVLFRKNFCCTKSWYALESREKGEVTMFRIKKKVTQLYDTFAMFEKPKEKEIKRLSISPAEFNAKKNGA